MAFRFQLEDCPKDKHSRPPAGAGRLVRLEAGRDYELQQASDHCQPLIPVDRAASWQFGDPPSKQYTDRI